MIEFCRYYKQLQFQDRCLSLPTANGIRRGVLDRGMTDWFTGCKVLSDTYRPFIFNVLYQYSVYSAGICRIFLQNFKIRNTEIHGTNEFMERIDCSYYPYKLSSYE